MAVFLFRMFLECIERFCRRKDDHSTDQHSKTHLPKEIPSKALHTNFPYICIPILCIIFSKPMKTRSERVNDQWRNAIGRSTELRIPSNDGTNPTFSNGPQSQILNVAKWVPILNKVFVKFSRKETGRIERFALQTERRAFVLGDCLVRWELFAQQIFSCSKQTEFCVSTRCLLRTGGSIRTRSFDLRSVCGGVTTQRTLLEWRPFQGLLLTDHNSQLEQSTRDINFALITTKNENIRTFQKIRKYTFYTWFFSVVKVVLFVQTSLCPYWRIFHGLINKRIYCVHHAIWP